MPKITPLAIPEIPSVFRVLIVDDRIGRKPAFQEQIRNTIDYWARKEYKAAGGREDLTVEVGIESSSVDGFNRWCNEVFDVALIDSDFRENSRTAENEVAFDLSKSLASTSYQGFEVLRLILDKTNPASGRYEKVFEYRQGANQVYLWSGLPYKPAARDDRAHPLEIGTLFRRYRLAREDPRQSTIFIPKLHVGEMENVDRSVESVVAEGVRRLLGKPPLAPAQQLERVLYYLSRSDLAEKVASFIGKFVFRDEKNEYAHYPRLGHGAPVLRIAECLPGSIDHKTAWLPLHGGLVQKHGLGIAVRYLLGSQSSHTLQAEYRSLRDDCKKDERLRRPRYPTLPRSTSADETTTVLGREFKNPFFAAATPLTGTTVVGEEEALAAMTEKVDALLNGPFGAVILKTAYLDYDGQWDNVRWPAIQMQSHMRTRCLFPPSGTSTIWNTGRTAMEMFPPRLLNRFLRELLAARSVSGASHRVIVSLGSKFALPRDWSRANPVVACSTLKGVWSRLFQDVFGSAENRIDEAEFPMIEVNARHTLREMVERQGRGDEYLSPLELDGDAFDLQDPILGDFLQWLQVIHEVAVTNKKQLIIKLPHRSDVFAFIKCVMWVRRIHLDSAPPEARPFGVRALTLINTIKSPVWPVVARHPYRQSWYASPTSWGDAANKLTKYQMAGALLSAHRGQVLAPLLERRDQLGDLEILIGGGVTDHTVMDRCLQDIDSPLGADGTAGRRGAVQIGTWALLDMRLDISSWKQAANPDSNGDTEDPATFQIVGCRSCGSCSLEAAPDHADYIDRPVGMEGKRRVRLRPKPTLTVEQIRSRLQDCMLRAVRLQRIQVQGLKSSKIPATNEIRPRFAWLDRTRCRACGSCSRTFYCDAFLDRRHQGLLPVFEPRHCTGCGLCAQICPHSALHLYEPSEYLVMVSHSRESDSYLTAIGIPHAFIHPVDDLARIHLSERLRQTLGDLTAEEPELPAGLVSNLPMESLLKERIEKNAHALGSGTRKLYVDDRKTLLESADPCFTRDSPRNEDACALIWSMLLWTDPGHVFWESPIVTIRKDGRRAVLTWQGIFVKTVTGESVEAMWQKLLDSDSMRPVVDALEARRSSAGGKP